MTKRIQLAAVGVNRGVVATRIVARVPIEAGVGRSQVSVAGANKRPAVPDRKAHAVVPVRVNRTTRPVGRPVPADAEQREMTILEVVTSGPPAPVAPGAPAAVRAVADGLPNQ